MQQLRPTFSESWYRVADLKARLRGSAQISRQHYRGDRWYVVRDPAGNQFHRLSAAAYKFIGLLDGTRTVGEAWDLVGGQLADDAPTQNEVIQILTQLHAANLLETNITPDAAVLLRRHKRMVKQQWQGRLMNVLFPRIPLWDPDRFLCRWMPVVKPFLSFFGGLVWLAVVFSAIFMLVPKWPELKSSASTAIDPNNWPFLWATFVLIKLIHELGHAFSCRRFGGEVHELGIMFLVFIPTPYVDASSAWSFPNKWAKVFVGAGGMIIELFVAAIMAFIWANTAPNTTIHGLAYNTMLIASVSTLIFNANPLLRYDGYYILSDMLEIPNLRYKSTEYGLGLIKRHLFGVKSQQPLPPVGQRIWLLLYAICSSAYRVLVGVTIIMVVSDRVPVLGVLMALGGVVTWLVVPVFKVGNYLLLDAELHRKRALAMGWTLAAAAVTFWVVVMLPYSPHINAQGIAGPALEQVMHTKGPGVVTQIVAKTGQHLKKDDPILVCIDRTLDAKVESMSAKLAAAKIKMEWARIADQAQYQSLKEQIKPLTKQLDDLKGQQNDLTLRAPFDGELIAPELHNLQGKYVQRGEEVGTVAQLNRLRIRMLVDQDDAAVAFQNRQQSAEIRLSGLINTKLKGTIEDRIPTVQAEAPHAALTYSGGGSAPSDPQDKKGLKLLQPELEMWVDLENPDQTYYPGQRAFVRFDVGQRTIWWQCSRRIGQLIQQHSHGKWL